MVNTPSHSFKAEHEVILCFTKKLGFIGQKEKEIVHRGRSSQCALFGKYCI